MKHESNEQKPWLDDVIKQATEGHLEQFAKETRRKNGGTGTESGPNINSTREEPDRVRPEKPEQPGHKDEYTK